MPADHVLGILVCGSTKAVSMVVINAPELHRKAKMETTMVRLHLLS